MRKLIVDESSLYRKILLLRSTLIGPDNSVSLVQNGGPPFPAELPFLWLTSSREPDPYILYLRNVAESSAKLQVQLLFLSSKHLKYLSMQVRRSQYLKLQPV